MCEPSTKDNNTNSLANQNVFLKVVGVTANKYAGIHLNIRKLSPFSRSTNDGTSSFGERLENVPTNEPCHSHYLDDTAQVKSLIINNEKSNAISPCTCQPVCSATPRDQDAPKPGRDGQ